MALNISDFVNRTFNSALDLLSIPSSSDLGQSKYDFTSRVFPEDLTSEDNSHYMVININVPVTFGGIGRGRPYPGLVDQSSILSTTFSKVDTLRFGPGPTAIGGQGQIGVFQRGTRRIAQSIALHMPQSGLVYTEDNKYQEVSLTSLMGDMISAISSRDDRQSSDRSGSSIDVGTVSSIIKKGSVLAGTPIIPRVQVMFATRPQRQWVFEVFMMPRSKTESATVKNIIKNLRFFAAPEIDSGGFTFIPPAEFDITFYRGGEENLNLPRINTCVLERIDLDYAPQGDYAVFDEDGHSVAVRMSLSFREIEILHKRRIYQGF